MNVWHIAGITNSPVHCVAPVERDYSEFFRRGWSDTAHGRFPWRGPFPTPQWKKEPGLDPAALPTLAVLPHLSGPQFPHMLIGIVLNIPWILMEKQEKGVWKGFERP